MNLSNLFRKNPDISPSKLVIKITERSADINGHIIDIPCSLKALSDILGKPRMFAGQAGNANAVWDDLGFYCYVNKNTEVYCLAVKVNAEEFPAGYEPKSFFAGQLIICGEQWEQALSLGEDIEIGRERRIGKLTLFGAYTDFENGDRNGCNDAYTGIEIQYHK